MTGWVPVEGEAPGPARSHTKKKPPPARARAIQIGSIVNTILDHTHDTGEDRVAVQRKIFVKRRFYVLFLPTIILGTIVYLVASAQTLTTNGLSLLGAGVLSLGAIAAAWDAGDRK